MSRITLFLSGKNPELYKIWDYNTKQLESKHDYIQRLFPLPEKSRTNPTAPVLTDEDIVSIRSNSEIQGNLIYSLKIMLNFYGFELEEKPLSIKPVKSALWMYFHWMTYVNHNYRRITRILKCLTICGLNEYAAAFYNAILNVKSAEKIIPQVTLEYWKNAIHEKQENVKTAST